MINQTEVEAFYVDRGRQFVLRALDSIDVDWVKRNFARKLRRELTRRLDTIRRASPHLALDGLRIETKAALALLDSIEAPPIDAASIRQNETRRLLTGCRVVSVGHANPAARTRTGVAIRFRVARNPRTKSRFQFKQN